MPSGVYERTPEHLENMSKATTNSHVNGDREYWMGYFRKRLVDMGLVTPVAPPGVRR